MEDVAVPRAEAWRMINDPMVLKGCTPGLETLEETTPGHFDAEISLHLPLVTGRFRGTVDQVERVEPERLRLRLKGKGPPGFVDGEATLTLAPSAKGTEFRYEADVQIGGQIARLGQRMLSGVTREMAGQFFEAFERLAMAEAQEAGSSAAAGAEEYHSLLVSAPTPVRAFFQLVWRTILNLLGLSKRSA